MKTKVLGVALAALFLSRCATVPSYAHDAEAQRLREAALRQSYGASLVTVGGFSVVAAGAGAVSLGVAGVKDAGAYAGPIIVGSVGLLALVFGVQLVASTQEDFTPPPAGRQSDGVPVWR